MPTLRADQAEILADPARFKAIMAGRRWGKNVTAMDATEAAIDGAQIAWGAPTFKIFSLAWRQLIGIYGGIAKVNKQEKLIQFPSGGLIEGWSLDIDDPGRGRNYDLWIVDEAGMVVGLINLINEAIRATLADRAGKLLLFGTPKVVCPDFPLLHRKWRSDTTGEFKAFSGKTSDNPFISRAEIESARKSMPEWQFLQEFEGIPADVMTAFFPLSMIDKHRESHVVPHKFRGNIRAKGNDPLEQEHAISRMDPGWITFESDKDHGAWKGWANFSGRLDQDRSYTLGADISAGVGSSNTTMTLIDDDSGEQLFEYADSRVLPERAAYIAAAMGIWAGGRHGPCLLNPEANGGAGETFIQTLHRLGYPNIAKRRKGGTTTSSDSSKREYGFWTTNTTKENLLSAMRLAMTDGRLQIHSDRCLDECLTYHLDEHNRLVSMTDTEDPTEDARVPHGDRVIAAALAWDGARTARVPDLRQPDSPREEFRKIFGKPKRR